jgi:FtsZ-interacting cell division protein ZipA
MMSDLQISLSIIGTIVVAGVYLFNMLQERKYKRKMEHMFGNKKDDVLMSSKTHKERREPVLEEITLDSIAPLGSDMDEVALEGELETAADTAVISQDLPVQVDLEIDCVARIHAAAPIAAHVVTSAIKLANTGKPLQWFGLNNSNNWVLISENNAASSEVLVAMQLADRSGPADEAQINSFFKSIEDFASEHKAVVELPDKRAALKQAIALDTFCADVDIQVGFHLIRQEGHFVGTRLRALAEASGFRLGETGFLEYLGPRGEVMFTLGNSEPTPFTIESLRQLSTHGLTFLFDVPRVAEGLKVFDQLINVAKRMELALGGMLVDDNRRPLDEQSVTKIRDQLQTTYAKMDAHDIKAGSTRALRLFS